MKARVAFQAALSVVALAGMTAAHSQALQTVEDEGVGVRIKVPKNWEWESRGRELFLDCAPGKENYGGIRACHASVSRHKIPAGQKTITDADRAKWRDWAAGGGIRSIVTTRDIKVAGFPAYDVVVRSGSSKDYSQTRRVFVLVPDKQVLDSSFTATNGQEYDRYHPAFNAALETIGPLK